MAIPGGAQRSGGGDRGGQRRPPQRRSEFPERVLEIRRVTRVVAGGKRMSFRVAAVVGDKRGRVGVGVAKGLDVASAVQKAIKQGERNMTRILLKEERTIPHDVEASYGASVVRIKPAKRGHGLIAGGSARVVLELAGIRDVSAKIMGRTKNKISNAYATIEALKLLHVRHPKNIVQKTEA